MRLIICSKSPWRPSIRREHLIAASAAGEDIEVVFVERPVDVRAARFAPRAWARALRSAPVQITPGVSVLAQATLVPGHVSDLGQAVEARRLAWTLGRLPRRPGTVVVATQPWQWPALAALRGVRRVVDLADDWRALIPRRSDAFDRLHTRIAREADAVLLASPALAGAFAGAPVTIAPNGVDAALADRPATPAPEASRLVYAGTLSERFDAPLLGEVMDRLEDWEAELYGPCLYAGHGDAPAPELRALLRRHAGRIRWCGSVERSELAAALDRGTVLIAPHRAAQVRGQDSMKLYDYAARRRPIVATPGALGSAPLAAAGVREAAGAVAFATTVRGAAQAGRDPGVEAWLAQNSWDARWPRWRAAAFGAAGEPHT